MPYLLNKSKANFRHPLVGLVEPLTAIEIPTEYVKKFKGMANVIIFNDIKRMKKKVEKKSRTELIAEKVLVEDKPLSELMKE